MLQIFYKSFARLDRYLTANAFLLMAAVGVESLVFGGLVFEAVNYVFPVNLPNPFSAWSPTLYFLVVVVIMPILETLVFQSAPYWALKKWQIRGWIFWLIMVAPFALAHSQYSIARGIGAGVVGGLYLGACYVLVRGRYSFLYAFAITASAHSLHNLIVVVVDRIFPD